MSSIVTRMNFDRSYKLALINQPTPIVYLTVLNQTKQREHFERFDALRDPKIRSSRIELKTARNSRCARWIRS